MKKSKKSILGKFFGRLVITIFLILVQFAWIGFAILKLNDYAPYMSILFNIGAVLMALFVIYRDDTSAYKLGWILLICLVPIFGATMYLFFGNKLPSRRIKARMDVVEKSHIGDLKQCDDVSALADTRTLQTVSYIANKGPYPAWHSTSTKYFDVADKAFVSMLDDMHRAEKFIFIEYFIIEHSYMWNKIFEILKIKAEKGVDVRVIYDDVGSIEKLPADFVQILENAGIKTLAFNPLRPVVSLVYNNRDHRKIMIVDGDVAHAGGYNIADEYINKKQRFGHWKDNGIRIEGKAVWNYTVMFLNMWNSFRKTDRNYDAFRPDDEYHLYENDGIVQPFSDSPLDNENLGENVYMEIINQAQEYVYIYTPYLIIDNEMLSSLRLAAKRGVDVRIITPGIPDKKIINRLTRSYYLPLINAGVRVYEYSPGFVHAKSIIADDNVGVVGSINLDYRSLYLHFECGTFMAGSSALLDLKEDFIRAVSRSDRITTEDCKTTFLGLLFDGVLRVLSPLM